MKAYELRRRVQMTRGKAKFAGMLYLLGALAMAAFACLAMFEIGGEKLWVVNFWRPIKDVFKAETRNWFTFAVSVLYGLSILIAVVNFFRCLARFNRLTKKSAKKSKGYNRSMCAMDEMGKIFSDSFAALVIFHFLIYIIEPVGDVKITYFAYAAVGTGLLLHFLCGLVGGSTSVFNLDKDGNVEEEKRPCRLFVYFFRNLVQLAAVAAILYFFTENCNFNETVTTALNGQNPFTGGVWAIVPLALELAMVLWTLVLIKHATAATEFNRFGIDGEGMKNFRIFSLFVALTAGGWYVIERFVNKSNPSWAFAIIAGIAFVAFLVDCIFKSRPKEKEEPVAEEDEEDEFMQMAKDPSAPAPVRHMHIYKQVPAPQYPQPMLMPQPPQPQPQPVYVPIYYPFPVNSYAPAQQQPAPVYPMQNQNIAATPAPEYLKPAPSPMAIAAEKAEEEKEELDPNKQWRVRCPRCGKELMVREVSPYHRCPACDKVFKLQKFKTYVNAPQA